MTTNSILAAVIAVDGSVAFHHIDSSPSATTAFAREQIGGHFDLGSALQNRVEFAVGEWSLRDEDPNDLATSILGRLIHGTVVVWGLTGPEPDSLPHTVRVDLETLATTAD